MLFLWITIALLFLIAVFVLTSYLLVELYAKDKVFEDIELVPENEYCLVLGTGPTRKDGLPNRFFAFRMNAAAALYDHGKVHTLILSGDRHEGYDEPAAMQKSLQEKGIPYGQCFLDGEGYDTIDSIRNARDLFHVQSLTIVSQSFHCERAVLLARSLGINAVGYAAEDVEPCWHSKTKVREIFARVKLFVDIFPIKLQS